MLISTDNYKSLFSALLTLQLSKHQQPYFRHGSAFNTFCQKSRQLSSKVTSIANGQLSLLVIPRITSTANFRAHFDQFYSSVLFESKLPTSSAAVYFLKVSCPTLIIRVDPAYATSPRSGSRSAILLWSGWHQARTKINAYL
jgi:hypothetical protein